jgi:hypothetical protein
MHAYTPKPYTYTPRFGRKTLLLIKLRYYLSRASSFSLFFTAFWAEHVITDQAATTGAAARHIRLLQ